MTSPQTFGFLSVGSLKQMFYPSDFFDEETLYLFDLVSSIDKTAKA